MFSQGSNDVAERRIRPARRQVTFAWPVAAVAAFCAAVGLLWPRARYVPAGAEVLEMPTPRMAFVELPEGVRGFLWPRSFTQERRSEGTLEMDATMQRPLARLAFREWGALSEKTPSRVNTASETWHHLALSPKAPLNANGLESAMAHSRPFSPEEKLVLQIEGGLIATGFEVWSDPQAWPEVAGEGTYWVELGEDGRVAHVLVLEGNGDARGVMRRWVERGRGRVAAAGRGIVRVRWREGK